MKRLFSLIRLDEGQDVAEYALLISLIVLVALAAVTLLGSRISAIFNSVAGAF